MHFIFSASVLAVMLLLWSRTAGMAVDPSFQNQCGIAKQDVQFSEDADAICESHRNYRQASIEPTAQVQKEASADTEELQIVIKHHTTPPTEEREDVDNHYIKRPVTSTADNEQLLKDLEKKMDSLESKDKYPKTRSYPASVLHHRGNRYDRPSNGNLEVFLGGSSSDSYEQGGYAGEEWQYQGLGNQERRYEKPVYPVPRYEGDVDWHKPRVEYPESHYENKEGSGYRTPGAGSGEYEQKRSSGYRNRGEGDGGDEYVPQRRKGYRTRDNSEEEHGYATRKKSGYRGYEDTPSGYEAQDESGYKKYGNQNEESGYRSGNEEDYYGKQENKYSSEKKSDEDVLVKISVNKDQDSPDLGKVKVDVKKDKSLFPDDRQLKISVKKDKDLPPGEEREIKLEVESDDEEEKEEQVKISVGKADCEHGDRTIVQVKKPKRKCCKKRKNKCSRKRKY